MSSPSTKCWASAASSSGSEAANSSASTMRSFSRRSVDCSAMTLEGSGKRSRGPPRSRSVSSSVMTGTLLNWFAVIPSLLSCSSLGLISSDPHAPADQERRKRLRLPDFERAFARHLKRRRETRRKRGFSQLGLDQKLGEKLVERSPVAIDTEQTLKLGARLFQRPHRALPDLPGADCGALPLLRIGLEQVVDISLVDALAGDADGLWSPAREHVAAEPLARQELRRDFTHGMQALQPEGEERGKLGPGGLTFLVLLSRKQELRFEKSEPGRHDEIVGGDLKTQAARLGDEV